jgi:hypothetical protein
MSVTERRKRDIPVTNAVADGDMERTFIRNAAPMLVAMYSLRRIAAGFEAIPDL